jgi:uncharacterized protein
MRYRLPLVVGLLFITLSALASAADKPRTISVRGKAEVTFPPDQALIRTAVLAKAPLPATAEHEARSKAALVISFARGLGVAANDISTDSLSLREEREVPGRGQPKDPVKPCFEATIGVSVVLRDLTRFDELLTGMTERGINEVHSLRLDSTERIVKTRQARIQAVLAAKEKASYLAQQLGLTLGAPISVEEVVARSYSDESLMISNVRSPAPAAQPDEGSAALSPGQLVTSAEYDLVFELVVPQGGA